MRLPAPSAPRAGRRVRCLLGRTPPTDDWGRSQRIFDLFEPLLDFYYRHWFRVDVEGIENVPSEGGALLVSNHAGAMPPDAAMIAKAVREEHPVPRPVYATVEHFFKGYPGLSMLIPKLGGVPAHPANVHRLLCDEQQLVLVFPEGRKGTEKLYRDRYRLRRFGRGGFVEAAMRARAPIVPVAVVGAEEAAPIFPHRKALPRLTRLMPARRILLPGLSTFWGGRLAQCLERDEAVEAIIGVDRTPPKVELARTEFVEVADSHSLIRRIVDAAEIDTVVDTRLVVDSTVTTPRRAHENNVIGTMNVLAACNGPDSPVRKVVFRSSAHVYGCEQDDPAFITEAMTRRHPPRTALERDIVEAEAAVRDFAERKPDVTVTRLRFVDGVGPGLRTSWSRLFALPVVPAILGFDPRVQFVHEDDIVGCLEHAVRSELPGVYNCAPDGVLALSELA